MASSTFKVGDRVYTTIGLPDYNIPVRCRGVITELVDDDPTYPVQVRFDRRDWPLGFTYSELEKADGLLDV